MKDSGIKGFNGLWQINDVTNLSQHQATDETDSAEQKGEIKRKTKADIDEQHVTSAIITLHYNKQDLWCRR